MHISKAHYSFFLCLCQITNMGRTTLLSTYNTQVTYVNPIILRIIFPTNSRPSSGNGFYISLSYDAKYFGDSVVMIIYNDVCYSCNASTLECINTVIIHMGFFLLWKYSIIILIIQSEYFFLKWYKNDFLLFLC